MRRFEFVSHSVFAAMFGIPRSTAFVNESPNICHVNTALGQLKDRPTSRKNLGTADEFYKTRRSIFFLSQSNY